MITMGACGGGIFFPITFEGGLLKVLLNKRKLKLQKGSL